LGTCEVYWREVFGRLRCYPNNETAHLLIALIGRPVFAEAHLTTIRALGFSIVEVPNPNMPTSASKEAA